MFRHSLRHHRKEFIRYGLFLSFFLFVSVVIFVLLYKAFIFFNSFEIIGEFLIIKLISTIFFVFFIFLILSNVNSLVKWFFTKNDLPFVLTNPVSMTEVFFTRSLEALFESSWAFLLFSIPVLLSYYMAVSRFNMTFFISCLLLLPFIIIPHGIAFILVMLLARFVSPKIIRNTFSFLSLILVALLVITFRAIQIEKLARPESFAHLYEYMRFLAIPTHPLLPTSPFIETIVYFTKGFNTTMVINIGFFLSTALALTTVSYWIHNFFYTTCYTNLKSSSSTIKRDILAKVLWFLPMKTKHLFLKEIKNLTRDPKEWSQVFLILALIFVYVYNFKLFPRDRTPLPTIFLESLLSFLNMGLLTFVISAISVRFVYPSFQLEGRPIWILLTSPVSTKELYVKKLILYVPPLLFLSLVLNYLSNKYISPSPILYYMSYGYVGLITITSPVISLYFGTKDINFRESPNPYGGIGGVISMLIMLIYAVLTLSILGWSSYWMVLFLQQGTIPPFPVRAKFFLTCIVICIATLSMVYFMVVKTIGNLKKIEL